jgi:cyclopropane-fatty-acyl-phospholipid synthase
MWPNGCLPSATVLIDAAHYASQGRFTLESVENHAARTHSPVLRTCFDFFLINPPDYPRTLREWGQRFDAHLTRDIIAKDYPALRDPAEFDAFKRKWHYLFAYAGAGFMKGYITCHMLTFIREVRLLNLIVDSSLNLIFLFILQNDVPEAYNGLNFKGPLEFR